MTVPEIPPGVYQGSVEGAESGHCDARLEVRRIPGGLSVDYEAHGAAGLQHAEHTLVMPGRLYVAHSESPVVTVMEEAEPGRYEAPAGPAPYSMGIVVHWDGTTLSWAWLWSAPGGPLVEQSKASAALV